MSFSKYIAGRPFFVSGLLRVLNSHRIIFLTCSALVYTARGGVNESGGIPGENWVFPNRTNRVQLVLHTNESSQAVFSPGNFELFANGVSLLTFLLPVVNLPPNQFPEFPPPADWGSDATDSRLGSQYSIRVLARTEGPEWQYTLLGATPADDGRLNSCRRGILYIAPDLFVICDHLSAKEPVSTEALLFPAGHAEVDPAWGDLLLNTNGVQVRVHSPAPKKQLRRWTLFESGARHGGSSGKAAGLLVPGRSKELDLITIFAVAGNKTDFAFKLLQSDTAIGARIHRNGLPVLVAFSLDPSQPEASLTGFKFHGPVGIDIFRPKEKR